MENYKKKAQIIDNVFTYEEIVKIREYFESAPVNHHFARQLTDNKNLDYEIPGSFANTFIRPKLTALLNDPDHKFYAGAYKEYKIPYPLHIDNAITTAAQTFRTEKKHETAFLIPLMEGPGLQTALFDVYFSHTEHRFVVGGATDEEKVEELRPYLLKEKTDIDMDQFDHINDTFKPILPYLPINMIVPWKIGSVITWHFDQLHCSTNFQKYNIVKKFVVIFVN